MKTKKTISERIMKILSGVGAMDEPIYTVAQMTKKMRDVKPSSLSSQLYKMLFVGSVQRLANIGPRGGYGYRRAPVEDLQTWEVDE